MGNAELLCPECLGTLEVRDGDSVRCSIHGGEYKVLFRREIPPVLPAAPAAPVQGTCANHPNVPAVFTCSHCGAAVCDLCAFPQADGGRKCPACASIHSQAPSFGGANSASAQLAVQNRKCKQHPTVAAVQICQGCNEPMCATCDFELPGNYHLCPVCATKTPSGLSPKRKRMLFASFGCAAWCTLVMAALAGGVFRSLARDKESEEALGTILMIILLVPSIIGVAMGVSARDRRLSNSIATWIAIIWNGVILGGFILLMIVGLFAKG